MDAKAQRVGGLGVAMHDEGVAGRVLEAGVAGKAFEVADLRASGAITCRWCNTRPPVAMPLAEMITDG